MKNSEIKQIIESIGDLNKKISSLITTQAYDEKLLDTREASEFLKISIPTIYKRTMKNTIPFLRVGKCLRFRKSELITWLNNINRAA